MKRATYYHAGCPVCTQAQNELVDGLDRSKFDVEIVDLSKDLTRLDEAEKCGVKTLPALVIEGKPFHINFGGTLSDLRKPEPVGVGSESESPDRWQEMYIE